MPVSGERLSRREARRQHERRLFLFTLALLLDVAAFATLIFTWRGD